MAHGKKTRTALKTRSSKWVSLGIVLMVVFIGELLAYTWCRVQYIGAGYDISQAVSEHQQLSTVQKKLQIELARLKSPERLAKIASRYMGLNMPTSKQMMVIE